MPDSLYSVLNPQFISGLIQQFPIKQMLSTSIYGSKTSETMDLDWDVIRGSYPMAPITGMNSPAPMCAPPNMVTMKGTAVVIKHKIPIKASHMLLLRRPGTLNEKYANQMVVDYAARVSDGVDFRIEWLKMMALTGAINYIDLEEGIQFNLDFGFKGSHKPALTGTNKWTDYVNSDPLSDIMTWIDLITDDGGAPADKLILNFKTLRHVLNNQKLRDLLKYTTDSDLLARFKGYINALGLELAISYGVYTDFAGANLPLVANNNVILLASQGNSNTPNEKTAVFIDAPNEYTMNVGKYGETIEKKDPKTTLILSGQNGLAVIQFPDRIVSATVA